jgi:hypothetical protein
MKHVQTVSAFAEHDEDPNGSIRILGTGDLVKVDGRRAKITKISQNGNIYVMLLPTMTTIKVKSWQIEQDLTAADIRRITTMIRQGYGAQGIHLETPYTIKQINSVFDMI